MANGCTNMDITLNLGGRVILMNTKVKIEFFHAAIFVHMPYRRDGIKHVSSKCCNGVFMSMSTRVLTAVPVLIRRFLIRNLHSSNFYTLPFCSPCHAISKNVFNIFRIFRMELLKFLRHFWKWHGMGNKMGACKFYMLPFCSSWYCAKCKIENRLYGWPGFTARCRMGGRGGKGVVGPTSAGSLSPSRAWLGPT